MPGPVPTLAELAQRNPKQPGENLFAYQQRLGSIYNQLQSQQAWPTSGPQKGNEPDVVNWARNAISDIGARAATAPLNPIAMGGKLREMWDGVGQAIVDTPGYVAQAFGALKDNPDKRVERAKAAAAAPKPAAAMGAGQPGNSFRDPAWNTVEAKAEQRYGLPPGLLSAIRTKGERSNGDQVSSAGAKTVYQFIPATAAGLKKNYGIDVFSGPEGAAMGAAALLAENKKRAGSWEGAVQQYHGGLDPSQYGPQNASYMQRVFGPGGAVEQGGGLQTSYDPRFAQQAMGMVDQATAEALKPQSATYNTAGAPEMPAPSFAAPTDFSKADAAIAALRPEEMTQKEMEATRRRNLFAGLGNALMQMEDGAGLGKVLAMAGGGALAGRAKGDAEIAAREDKFDEQMARYNVALANQENSKAQTIHAELQHIATETNRHALQKFTLSYDKFFKENFATVQGGMMVTSRSGPDGKVTVTSTPMAGAIKAQGLMQKAQIMSGMGSDINNAQQQVQAMRNSALLGAAAQQAQLETATPRERGDAIVLGTATLAQDLVSGGRTQDFFGPEFEGIQKEVGERLGQQGLMPGSKEYVEAYGTMMSERIMTGALSSPVLTKRLMQIGGAASQVEAARREREARQTVRTGPKGTTTSTEYR